MYKKRFATKKAPSSWLMYLFYFYECDYDQSIERGK